MKKIMFITLTILFALSASSCRDKKEQNRTEQQIENAKENVNDALDKASNKIEDGADKVFQGKFLADTGTAQTLVPV